MSNISESSLFYEQLGYVGGQFNQCSSLTRVILNPNITKLPNDIFSYIGAELYITIPAGVTEIGRGCFYATYSHLTMLSTTPPTLISDSNNNNPLLRCREIIVPAGTLATYQAASGWSQYASIMSENTV